MIKLKLHLFLCLLGISLLIPTFAYSQNPNTFEGEQALVYQTIKNLFDGMRDGDSALVHSVFHDDARLLTTYTRKNGETVLQKGSLEKFLQAVGTPHEEIWDEKLFNIKIDIDDNLAQVWAEYTFYLGENFSHCGVNCFQLFKEGSNWKIIQLTDTRRKLGCIDR